MSTKLCVIQRTGVKGVPLHVGQFAGPADSGQMLQLTQGLGLDLAEPGFVQLTRDDAGELVHLLLRWLNKTDPPGEGFESWYLTYWQFGSSSDRARARRAFEAAKSATNPSPPRISDDELPELPFDHE